MQRGMKPDRITKRRQDPVSCRLCRVKKLKCNRQNPCSNCVTRGATCEFEQQAQVAPRTTQDDEPSNAAILARLQRLEDLLMRMGQNTPSTPDSFSRQPIQSTGFSPMTQEDESHQRESRNLVDIGRMDHSTFPGLSDNIVFEVVPIDQIINSDGSIIGVGEPQSYFNTTRRIPLPPREVAEFLFEKYATAVSFYHHVVHLPTVHNMLKTTYDRLQNRTSPELSHVILLLTVFATVLWYLTWNDDITELFNTRESRERMFSLWFKSALDVLDHSRRTISGSLEEIQALVILVFLDYNVEGFTARSRSAVSHAIQMGRDLALHRLDAPPFAGQQVPKLSKEEVMQKEIKRRVWWHLVSTEWMVSLAGGPSEGTYNAHPHHMKVDLPRNINDEELESGDPTIDFPLSRPTIMTYNIHRTRLAELSRCIVDTLRSGISEPGYVDYQQVRSLDDRFKHFIDDIPPFLRLDEESIRQTEPLLNTYPHFAVQRYIINISANSLRCKLHQPFLVRGSHDPNYAFSTETCLSAAMTVLQINQNIRNEDSPAVPRQFKLMGLTHHLFLATVVLVMDMCFNRIDSNEDPRRPEVMHAIRMLEEAKNHSAAAQKFLESLMDVLKKHKIRLVDMPQQANRGEAKKDGTRVIDSMVAGLNPLTSTFRHDPLTPVSAPYMNTKDSWHLLNLNNAPSNIPQHSLTSTDIPMQSATASALDEVWRDFADQGAMNNMPDWEQLFSELDAYIA